VAEQRENIAGLQGARPLLRERRGGGNEIGPRFALGPGWLIVHSSSSPFAGRRRTSILKKRSKKLLLARHHPKRQKFLGSFFQKRTACLRY
jgi:hypothetical protein